MARKVILDVDPGIDDAMALCLALSNADLDVVAVTAVGGNVAPAQATRNVQAVIEQLDPQRWPRLGAASEPDNRLAVDRRNLYGSDGLGGVNFAVAERQHLLPSEKVICDQVRDAPHEVTIVALGPLTNIARAFVRDPELPALVGRIVIMGGTVSGPGNITPAAEFNMYCDPVSAQAVFRSPSTKTLVPLDVTNGIELSYDLFRQLPDESTRVGRLLRQLLPPAFRGYRQQFGLEGIHVHDTVTLMAVICPELFTAKPMAGDVETQGELTVGATVFDRRRVPAWRHNMEVAVDMQKDAVVEAIFRGLAGC
jgi:inosine-uridine nucleoside N-ribohydrolase